MILLLLLLLLNFFSLFLQVPQLVINQEADGIESTFHFIFSSKISLHFHSLWDRTAVGIRHRPETSSLTYLTFIHPCPLKKTFWNSLHTNCTCKSKGSGNLKKKIKQTNLGMK